MFSLGATLDDKVLPIEHQEFKIDRHDNIVPQIEFSTAFCSQSTMNATDQGFGHHSPCCRNGM